MNILKQNQLNLNALTEFSQKPELFAPGQASFWIDPHISKSLLKTHLDPEEDLASRRPETIDKSVEWIVANLDLAPGSLLLDLGCGPGLYCTRFYERGLTVTGMDFSPRSINYAQNYAQEHGMNIDYIYQNYLELDLKKQFDAVSLIYCDFCVLSDHDRSTLLTNINRALKPDGCFVLDVITEKEIEATSPDNYWEYLETGFWKPSPHLVLGNTFVYPEDQTRLNQYVVIEEDGTLSVYRNWLRGYTLEQIRLLLKEHGFSVETRAGFLTGEPYQDDSMHLAIIAKKENSVN